MASYFTRFVTLSFRLQHEDEPWEYTEEPHTSRRQKILKKHPEIKKLMGYDPTISLIVSCEVIAQIFLCWLLQDVSWGLLLFMAYTVGGSLNHSLGSAIHEIGHNLAFGHRHPLWNRALGMFCNLPMGIPMSISYKKYHADHHRWLGHMDMDVDIPTYLESVLFRHPVTRIIWLIIHPAIHGIRPFYKSPKPMTTLEIINTVLQFAFNFLIYKAFGVKAVVYLVSGTLLGLGLHPLAGHFISEHYMFTKGQATHSYYGPLNAVLFNVGYHVEHHDFPYIPYNRLPEVREIAKEFYDPLPHHTSWLRVLWDFVFHPEMGPQGHGTGFLKSDADEIREARSHESEEMYPKGKCVQINGHHEAMNGKKID